MHYKCLTLLSEGCDAKRLLMFHMIRKDKLDYGNMAALLTFCNIYKRQVKCNIRKSMCVDDKSIYLKVFPPCSFGRNLSCRQWYWKIPESTPALYFLPASSKWGFTHSLGLNTRFYQPLDTGTLSQRFICMSESPKKKF